MNESLVAPVSVERESLVSQFRIHLRQQGYSEGTVLQRTGDIQRMIDSIGDPHLLASNEIVKYLSPERRGWKPEYRKRVSASIRIFYSWMLTCGFLTVDPACNLPLVRVPRSIPRPVPESVVLSAFAAGTLAERAMLALGATLGLRREEIATAHPHNRQGAALRVVGKNSDERVVPLDELTGSLLSQIEVEQGTDAYYFPGRFGGHLHPATVYKWVKARLGENWSTHNLRHRAATIGLESTGDIRAVQELLGHRSITSTQLYTAVTGSRAARVVASTSLGTPRSSRHVAGLSQSVLGSVSHERQIEELMRLLASLRIDLARPEPDPINVNADLVA